MLYGSETWCLRENDTAILRRTEKAVCGVKVIEKRRSQDLMSLLCLKDTLDGLARASGVRWYGYVLRRYSDEWLRRALDFEVVEKRGRGLPNMTWKRQLEEHIDKIGRMMPLTESSGVMVFSNFLEARVESGRLC